MTCSICGGNGELVQGRRYCRECNANMARAWRERNRARYLKDKRARWAKRRTEYVSAKRRYYTAHRDELLAKAKERNSDPKRRARVKIQSAVKRRRIIKPLMCERCKTPTPPRSLHGHHEDHNKPLEVIWLCRRCHGEAHRVAVLYPFASQPSGEPR